MGTHTWAVGDILTAADMNNYVRDMIQQCAAVARSAGTQVVGNATQTEVTLDSTEDFDTDGIHSLVTTTARFTPPVAGYYVGVGVVQFSSSVGGTFRQAAWIKNGSFTTSMTFARMPITAGFPTNSIYLNIVSIPVQLNGTTDYLSMTAHHDTGSNMTLGNSWGGIYRIRT